MMASTELSAEGSIGFRPVRLLFSSLATFVAIDVLNILYKKKKKIETFSIQVEGQRSGVTPSVFTHIDLHFVITGDVKEKQIQKAIDTGPEQYCSV